MTHNNIKFIKNLAKKNQRYKAQLFVCEGEKLIIELFNSGLTIEKFFTTQNNNLFNSGGKFNFELISNSEMERISFLKTPTSSLALIKIPTPITKYCGGIALVLDTIQDPGNLGTIIRVAAWYGVRQIFCSHETADCFSPKVVQATMGAIAAVDIIYTDLQKLLNDNKNIPAFGTFLINSTSINSQKFPSDAFIVMGNEGQGISPEIEKLVQNRIFIPPFGEPKNVESLNVAVATAITLAQVRRG